jgi:pimeloyl-ACP methyl ester carboxylesterase
VNSPRGKICPETGLAFLDQGTGQAVVLAHAYLWDAEVWRPQIEALSRRYRVIVPTLWGHGESRPLPADVTDLGDIAKRHLALLDRLGIDRFAFIGHSAGAMWGAELACLAPGRVTALGLLSTFVGTEPEDYQVPHSAMLDRIAAAGAVPDCVLAAIGPYLFSPRFTGTMPDAPARFRMRLAQWDPARLLDSIVPLGRMFLARREALTRLVRHDIPALVLTGADDQHRPVHEGRRMAHALGCGFAALPGVGHMATIEAPDLVNDHLLAFLDPIGRPAQLECRAGGLDYIRHPIAAI